MATTFTVDDELGDKFRAAIKNRFPNSYGQIKQEVRRMVKNHITLLEAEAAGVKL